MTLPFARPLLTLALMATMAIASSPGRAQSTDGFHSLQVFPVVVDSASFVQAFDFIGDQRGPSTIEPVFYPAGQALVPSVPCPAFQLASNGRHFGSLRALCPGLASGSQFGMLVLTQAGTDSRPFSGFSRVSNPAGAGFVVEAFPAHTFTSAQASVVGLARKTATRTSPAVQSNCFLGLLPERNGGATAPSQLNMSLSDVDGNQVGTQGLVYSLWPGQLVRVLDIFEPMNAPRVDLADVKLHVRNISSWSGSSSSKPGMVAFCTVQENTGFSAEFRIAKQQLGLDRFEVTGIAAQDNHVDRETLAYADLPATGGVAGREYAITAGSGTQTSHVIYFRHPDWVACELINTSNQKRADVGYGLELRLLALDPAGPVVVAGGNDATGWSRVYLGDKRERGGENTRYLIQVEDNEHPGPVGSIRYGLHCESGSGHTPGDVIAFQRMANEF